MAISRFEMESFITKFESLTSMGCKASLNFTSSNGQVSVTLSADLGYCVPPYFNQSTSNLPRRRHRGPAYFRRQLRRHNAAKASSSNADNSTEVEHDVELSSNPDVLLSVIAVEPSPSRSDDNILCVNDDRAQLPPSVTTASQNILPEMQTSVKEKSDQCSSSSTSHLDATPSEKTLTMNDCVKYLECELPKETMMKIDEYLCFDPSPSSKTLDNIAHGLNIPTASLQQYVESRQSKEMTSSIF